MMEEPGLNAQAFPFSSDCQGYYFVQYPEDGGRYVSRLMSRGTAKSYAKMFKGIVHRHSKAPFYYRFYPNEPLVLLLSAILAGLLMSFLFIAAANSDESFKPLSKAEPVVRMVLQEAVSEPLAGQVAVAGVALDRMKDRRWPDTSKEVVYQAWQFTGMRAKLRDYSPKEIEVARLAVQLAESGTRPCGTVLWYHTTGIDKPWNDSLQVSCLIGNHIFYGDKETRYGATRG